MNPTENQLEAQISDGETKSILSVRNLVIGGTIILLTACACTFAYIKCMKSKDVTAVEANATAEGTKVIAAPSSSITPSITVTNTASTATTTSTTTAANATNTATDATATTATTAAVNNSISTTFWEAITAKKLSHLELLIERGERISAEDINDHDVLHKLVSWGDIQAIDLLIKNGLDINQTYSVFMWGESTPLMIAIGLRKSEIAEHLIENGSDLSILNSYGDSAMDYAIQYEDIKTLELILDKDPVLRLNLNLDCNLNHKYNIFFYLANNENMIDLLIKKSTFDVNMTNSAGRTLLHYTRKAKVAEYLIDHNIDLNAVDNNSYSALHHSINRKTQEVSIILIENGADLDLVNDLGSTPMRVAILENQSDTVKLLLDKGKTPEPEFKFGTYTFSPLGCCIHLDYSETAKVLIQAGAASPTEEERNKMILKAETNETWSFINELRE